MSVEMRSGLYPQSLTGFMIHYYSFIQTPYNTINRIRSLLLPKLVRPFARLTLPSNHVILTSFSTNKSYHGGLGGCLELTSYSNQTNLTVTSTYCSDVELPVPHVYNASLFTVTLVMTLSFVCRKDPKIWSKDCVYTGEELFWPPITGFEMLYSYHAHEKSPQQLKAGGKWNCSVAYWPDFQQHFVCNLLLECHDGQDEQHCPYTTSQCRIGAFKAGDVCMFLVRTLPKDGATVVRWMDGADACAAEGGQLASLKTKTRKDQAAEIFASVKIPAYAGLVGFKSASLDLPRWYTKLYQYEDGTVDFRQRYSNYIDGKAGCCFIVFGEDIEHTNVFPCVELQFAPGTVLAVCEHPAEKSIRNGSVDFPDEHAFLWNSTSSRLNFRNYLPCQLKHVTHNFLACDVSSSCWSRDRGLRCTAPVTPRPPSFQCQNGEELVPYSLVCDSRVDCGDRSDEAFCRYPRCDWGYIPCGNGQCIPVQKMCDEWQDCFNGADENSCSRKSSTLKMSRFVSPPALLFLESDGAFSTKTVDNTNSSRLCPDTHFMCPDYYYCMPVFLCCNGILDCLNNEDEKDCESYTCPGMFRCRGSRVCLHPDNVCDGQPHCPQQDDELMCGFVCPEGCLCYGWAFFCSRSFPAVKYPQLRYLDAHGTSLTFVDLGDRPLNLLLFLNFSCCNLSRFDDLKHTYDNLLTFDVSYNFLKSVSSSVLTRLPQLRVLTLSGNPLEGLFTNVHESFLAVRVLDLSRVPMTQINVSGLSDVFPNLQVVNLSHTGLVRLSDDGFLTLKQLLVVDLTGCPVTQFSNNMFQGLVNLQTVYADSFKLCCPILLPAGFNVHQCQAPADELSSCENLLGSAMYTASVFVFCLFAVVGNLASFVYRSFFNRSQSKLGFGVLVTHLSLADLVMGLYLAIIGCTDRLYQGTYLWHEHSWRHSVTCSVAGFLSLLSSEVSALILCLITLDRFLVLRFPFSRLHFGRASAHMASVAVWVLGLVLASVPLMISHWEFYSQTGICIPLPITRTDFPGRVYSFSIIIVFNFVLFLCISLGQVVIYWSVRVNAMSTTSSTKKTKDMTIARRLITVALSDFLCWFPIGLLGLLASRGVPVSSEVNVAMAVLVLPLNAALNPFLYTINVIMERRRKVKEERLRRWIASQLQAGKP